MVTRDLRTVFSCYEKAGSNRIRRCGYRVLGLVNVADNTAVNSRVVQTANVRRSAIIPNLVGVAALYGAVASKRHQSIRTFA